MRFLKRAIAIVLTYCIMISAIATSNTNVFAMDNSNDQYNIYKEDVLLTKVAPNIELKSDKNAIMILEDGNKEEHTLNFNVAENDSVIDEIDDAEPTAPSDGSISEPENDRNTRVAGLITAWSIAKVVAVVVAVPLTVYIGNVLGRSVAKSIATIKNNKEQKKIYRAYLSGKEVYIDYANPITQANAVLHIMAGGNVYVYDKATALNITNGAGGILRNEIDGDRKEGYIYYWHFHPKTKPKSHIWYGEAYTK